MRFSYIFIFTFLPLLILIIVLNTFTIYTLVAYIVLPSLLWLLVLFLSVTVAKSVFNYVKKSWRKKTILLTFALYLPIHLFVYSLSLEKLLSIIYGLDEIFPYTQFLVTYTPFPLSPIGIFFTLLFDPSLDLFISPIYYLSLTPFSIITAIIISIIVSANVGKIIELFKNHIKIVRQIALVITLGLVAGSTCCLSLPSLIAFYTPFLSNFVYNTVSGEILLIAYFVLPIITILVLIDQFRKVLRIEENINRKDINSSMYSR